MTSDTNTTSESIDFARRPQVAVAVRQLLRHIHTCGLEVGDRLPSHEELRVKMGFHNKTLMGAMEVLTTYGVLVRKRKVGTILIDPDIVIPNLWRVGMTLIPAVGEVAFFGQLLHQIQGCLRQAGAIPFLFMLPEYRLGQSTRFRHFPGLWETMKSEQLDGLLDIASIRGEDWAVQRQKGLALAYAGSWEDAPAGVLIEQTRMVERAVELLYERGCRRLAVVSMKGPKPGFARFWKGFIDATSRVGLVGEAALSLFGGEGPHGGQRVAQQLLARPPRHRPDGLIVIDDRIGSGLAATLTASDPSYRPAMVVQTNRQAPMAFALPVIHCELDVAEMAQRAVGNLMLQMLNTEQPLQRYWIYPQIHSDTAVNLVATPSMAAM